MLFRRPFLDLVLPVACVICQRPNGAVCKGCELSLNVRPRKVTRFDLNGFSVFDYSAPVANLISSYKEHAQIALVSGFASAIEKALSEFEVIENFRKAGLVIVPVPDHPDSNRSFSPTSMLAKNLATRLGLTWLAGLTMRSAVRDQAGLNDADRRNNLVNAMSAKSWMRDRRVMLVDDLVTTGSTLLEAKRALAEVGCEVVAFATFAETLKKLSSRNSK